MAKSKPSVDINAPVMRLLCIKCRALTAMSVMTEQADGTYACGECA